MRRLCTIASQCREGVRWHNEIPWTPTATDYNIASSAMFYVRRKHSTFKPQNTHIRKPYHWSVIFWQSSSLQLVKKFPVYGWAETFITVSTGAAKPIPTYATHFLSTYQQPVLLKISRNVTHLNTIFKWSYLLTAFLISLLYENYYINISVICNAITRKIVAF